MKKAKKLGKGQPTKYKEEYCQMLIDYFDVPATYLKSKIIASAGKKINVEDEESSELPTFIGFAMSIGVCDDTLTEWKDKHPNFSAAYKKARKLQEQLIIKNGMKGRYNTIFSLFMLKCNHGWREKDSTDESNEGKDIVLKYNLDEK